MRIGKTRISLAKPAVICLAMLLAFTGKTDAKTSAEGLSTDQKYNVVILLIDALRADHVSSYGYYRKTNPEFDRLTQESFVFENCISQAWYTLPSHASLFTSEYAHTHNVTEKNMRLPEKEITLAEILSIYGYKTAAFVGGIFLEPAYGLNQGFETYYASTTKLPKEFPFRLGKIRDTMPKALQWIEENKEKNFFVFIHGYDLFMPARLPDTYKNMFDPFYRGSAEELLSYGRLHIRSTSRNTFFLGKPNDKDQKEISLNKTDIGHIIANYDAADYHSDVMTGVLCKRLKELNLAEKTIVIVTSDHGTDLLDHGTLHLYMDGSAYDETLRVPLLIRHPAVKSMHGRIKTQVQLIDIMPTILDFLNIPINKEAQGKSLLPLIRGKGKNGFNKYVFSGWRRILTVRTERWKLIYSRGKYELYDLKNDPHELRNVAHKEAVVFNELIGKLFSWSLDARPSDPESQIQLDKKLVEKLEKAGYW